MEHLDVVERIVVGVAVGVEEEVDVDEMAALD